MKYRCFTKKGIFLRSDFAKFCTQKKRLCIFVFILTLVITVTSIISEKNKGLVLKGSRNSLSSVEFKNSSQGEQLIVKAVKDGKEISKKVYLRANQAKKSTNKENGYEKDNMELNLSNSLRRIQKNIKLNEKFVLPQSLDDGTRLNWSVKSQGLTKFLPLTIAPLIIFFAYRQDKDKAKKFDMKRRADIIRALPAFTTKLELFLGCGMVYEDAMQKIVCGYKHEKSNELSRIIDEARQAASITGRDEMEILEEKSKALKIKELTRITAMIADSRYKGNELGEKLTREGEILWQRRIKSAEENSKIAEVKLSLPLGLQLLSLIIITAAPAVMQF